MFALSGRLKAIHRPGRRIRSPEAEAVVRARAFSIDGRISISHFIIAFDALVKGGVLKKIRTPRALVPVKELTVQEYRSIPAAVTVQKYRSDPEFPNSG